MPVATDTRKHAIYEILTRRYGSRVRGNRRVLSSHVLTGECDTCRLKLTQIKCDISTIFTFRGKGKTRIRTDGRTDGYPDRRTDIRTDGYPYGRISVRTDIRTDGYPDGRIRG